MLLSEKTLKMSDIDKTMTINYLATYHIISLLCFAFVLAKVIALEW
jgi:hypothetical protein